MDQLFTRIDGVFYRGIAPTFREQIFSGSRAAGRYSRPGQPTLYLSSSPEGVEAAMIAHKNDRPHTLEIVEVRACVDKVFDLRNEHARSIAGVDLGDAIASWQEIVAAGGEPTSWKVRDRLEALGAHGLIDPSRKAPGLWHLVLFSWDSASVQISQRC